MIPAQCVSGPTTGFKGAEMKSQHSALKEQGLHDWWCVGGAQGVLGDKEGLLTYPGDIGGAARAEF